MRIFKRIAIVGTGLIGGSLALAVKERRIADEVIGVTRHKKNLDIARKRRMIDKGSQDLSVIARADLLVLATPVRTILKLADKISGIVRKGCIVTDVGSTKQEIASKLGRVFDNYVGAHPLAGSEKKSLIYARADLFKDSLCILTPSPGTNPAALKKVKELWAALGAKTVFLSPAQHDRVIASVSHLPHVVAFSLINCVPKKYFKFAASGLKDATRIAASDSGIWEDIFLSNQRNVLKTIETFQRQLCVLKSALKRKDKSELHKILRLAKAKRKILG